ncbi:phosphonate C-P lyase system protein PhnG [Mameliella alba]|nr:phosphonate C-P lyase system protein PhnG [Mameliella alba]MBY6171397.1 phosphonate C-P lyase system protein PhnG [Mameliella alba]MBY6176621.1 phosphonate C-P lyase system protein PhnG [Mameliella alba]
MQEQTARKNWMSLLAKSPPPALNALMEGRDIPGFTWLRAPEIGAAMVRGRMGGTGAPFNMGEMTVTRCSLQLDDGTVGHGYVQGRDKAHAERAALVDALMQTDAAATVEADVLTPLRARMADQAKTRAAKAAATKVEFFTLVRGED